ncbi:4-coumarate-CoA ligase 2 [Schizothecium vesticola]|uniref:4-coumarate-CoA ligase 2 n=1 Tax=Schizothecium vesticola TaxID=314040 RepID=A0AA40F7G3_9PEZI|nr:4-coumarate-CoA ligase 2 [Schizothecium vesticola]
MRLEKYGRRTFSTSRNPFTCGLTGRTFSYEQFFQRADDLAKSLSRRTGWTPNEETPWDKVLGIFSLNTIDYIVAAYAVHRVSGIASLASASYSAPELAHQLKSSGVKVLFTCIALLDTALAAAAEAGIPKDKVFILPMTDDKTKAPFLSIEDLIVEGASLDPLPPLKWTKGQGERQPAFLCYSSGTSGLPKAVMISHRNVIANVLQHTTYESVGRKLRGVETQVELGLLPMSHIYSLVVISHCATWRGDEIIILPKFDFETYLASIQRFRIEKLIIVPPIIIRMLQSHDICKRYDLSSVRFVFSGAAPLGQETIQNLLEIYPTWTVAQAYGMTESAVVVTSSSEHDVMHRSSGSLIPGFRAKIMDPDGNEILEHDKPGELLVQSPSIVLGYLNNEAATTETFVHHDDGRWLRTGDEVLMTLAPSGYEHLVVVDRLKELIKVKGMQVSPAELESHILAHPAVFDCAVIQTPDERAGEVPKAYVVVSPEFSSGSREKLARLITQHVADHKPSYKWIKGGVEFVTEIPKSPTGKILRRLLRDKEREKRRSEGTRL